jgi:hypothetical protein
MGLTNRPTGLNNIVEIKRSSLQQIQGYLNLNFPFAHSVNYLWKAFELNESNFEVIRDITFDTNPTRVMTQVTLIENTFAFGLYKLSFYANLFVQNISLTFQEEINTFIQIVPSGINVYGLQNGLNQISIGRSQAFSLMPIDYSYDLDYVVNISSLDFKFYCKVMSKSAGFVYYLNESGSNFYDLYTGQAQNLALRNDSCFNSTSNVLKLFELSKLC